MKNNQEKLRELLESRFGGNQTALAAAVGTAPPAICQILSGKKRLGEALARRIESSLSLPPGTFETTTRGLRGVSIIPKESSEVFLNRVARLNDIANKYGISLADVLEIAKLINKA